LITSISILYQMTEKILQGWDVTLTHPEDLDKEERRILIEKKKYKTLKDAHKEIEEKLEGTGCHIGFEVLRKIANKSYRGKNGLMNRCLNIEKCEIKIKIQETIV